MRQYTMEQTKQVSGIICNKCGKEIKIEHGVPMEDVLSVEKRWGYLSEKDNEHHIFDLCESCYDAMISSFKHPVQKDI